MRCREERFTTIPREDTAGLTATKDMQKNDWSPGTFGWDAEKHPRALSRVFPRSSASYYLKLSDE
jgi:hypothetical protein